MSNMILMMKIGSEKQELVLEQGKIYYLDYGNNTQIVGRYKETVEIVDIIKPIYNFKAH